MDLLLEEFSTQSLGVLQEVEINVPRVTDSIDVNVHYLKLLNPKDFQTPKPEVQSLFTDF